MLYSHKRHVKTESLSLDPERVLIPSKLLVSTRMICMTRSRKEKQPTASVASQESRE